MIRSRVAVKLYVLLALFLVQCTMVGGTFVRDVDQFSNERNCLSISSRGSLLSKGDKNKLHTYLFMQAFYSSQDCISLSTRRVVVFFFYWRICHQLLDSLLAF